MYADYYEILGIERTSSPDELKKAYRKLAMQYHPDRNPGDSMASEKFKEATEAFQVLSDPQKRARYDRFGHGAPEGFGMGGGEVDLGSMTDFFESIFGSVFGGMAGGRRRQRKGTPGRDLQYDLDLTLEDVVRGAKARLSVPRPVRCGPCHGVGTASGTEPERCSHCGGEGAVRLQQGIFAMTTTCPACSGTGESIRNRCPQCQGKGRVIEEQSLEVEIPAGVDDGAVKVLRGQGEEGLRGAPDGDLHIMIHVKKHETFVRRGQDLLSVVRVSYPTAVLGGDIEVPTVDGKVSMRVKPGTENGQMYRLRGKGVPSLRSSGPAGDQLVHIDVAVPAPSELSPRQKELIVELGKEFGDEVQSRPHQSFIGKLKGLFD
ncbi:MAG: molecular chaperone DnaJ [Myxococcota bacterium]|nr:molecular chaperone DnaJ [Myxococcota bacterium]